MMGSEPPLPDTPRISGNDQESGLWLLHGQTPEPTETTTPAPPAWRAKGIVHLLGFAARGAKRLASRDMLWLGLVLIGLVAWAAVIFLPDEDPLSKDTPVAESPPVPSPVVATPAEPGQPADDATTAELDQASAPPAPSPVVATPAGRGQPAAATTAELDQASAPPSLIGQPMEEPTRPWAHKARRSHRRRLVRRVHGAFVQRWASEPCRYSCDDSPTPMAWHGGGY